MRRPQTTRFPPLGYIFRDAPQFKSINRWLIKSEGCENESLLWSFVEWPAVYVTVAERVDA